MLLVDTVQWIYYLEMCKINRSCCLNRLVSKEVSVAVSTLLSSIPAAYILLLSDIITTLVIDYNNPTQMGIKAQ